MHEWIKRISQTSELLSGDEKPLFDSSFPDSDGVAVLQGRAACDSEGPLQLLQEVTLHFYIWRHVWRDTFMSLVHRHNTLNDYLYTNK